MSSLISPDWQWYSERHSWSSLKSLLPSCCQVASVVSDSVWPHRRQPTRLPCPWDSPGKNTGVDCHFLLQYIKVKSESEVAQSCPTLSDPMDCSLPGSSIHGIFQARVLEWGAIAFSIKSGCCCCCCSCCFCWVTSVMSDSVQPQRWQPTKLPCPWDSPGKNTGEGCHFLLQCVSEKWKWSLSVMSNW